MPFLAPALPLIGAGLSGLGAIGKGRAAGRQAESESIMAQDRLRQQADQTGLQSARFNAEMPGLRAHDAVKGDILSGLQSASLSGGGRDLKVSGGLSPALLSQNTRNYGQAMNTVASGGPLAQGGTDINRQALLSQLGGSYKPFKPSFTGPSALPQAGLLDKILNGAGYAGGALDLYKQTKDEEK
jgi:hypothetical protein